MVPLRSSHWTSNHSKAGVALAAALTICATPGRALDLCVSCQTPDAHYNCHLETASSNARDLRLQLLCITELAHGGGHANCAVDRVQQSPCPGTTKTLAAPAGELGAKAASEAPPPEGSAPAATMTPAQDTVKSPPKADPKAQPANPNAPPKTVQEMVEKGAANTSKGLETAGGAVKDAATSTGGALQNAETVVGNAAKKTWHCLSTFFGEC